MPTTPPSGGYYQPAHGASTPEHPPSSSSSDTLRALIMPHVHSHSLGSPQSQSPSVLGQFYGEAAAGHSVALPPDGMAVPASSLHAMMTANASSRSPASPIPKITSPSSPSGTPTSKADVKQQTMNLLKAQKARATQPQAPGAGGISLSGYNVVVHLDDSKSNPNDETFSERKFQPPVTPIALLSTKPVYQSGSLVAANSRYVCYAVRGGQIRAIDLTSAQRDGLSEHTDNIVDLTFFSPSSNVLGSVAADGSLILWKLFIDEASKKLSHRVLFWLKPDPQVSPAVTFQRFMFHPASPTVAATYSSDNKLQVWNFSLLSPHFSDSSSGPALIVEAAELSSRIPAPQADQGPPMDICFSPDGQVLGVASVDGSASVYSVAYQANAHPVLTLLHRWYPHQRTPVFSLRFLGGVLLTGSARNAELKLWYPRRIAPEQLRIDDASSSKDYACLQTLTFKSHDGSQANLYHILSVDVSRPDCLFIANPRKRSLISLHLAPSASGIAQFDWATEIDVVFPITSLLCLHRPELHQFSLFSVQLRAIQIYNLPTPALTPPPGYVPAPSSVEEPPASVLSPAPSAAVQVLSVPVPASSAELSSSAVQAASTSPDLSLAAPRASPARSEQAVTPDPVAPGDDSFDAQSKSDTAGSDEADQQPQHGSEQMASGDAAVSEADPDDLADQDLVPPSAFFPGSKADTKRRRRRERKRSTIAGTSTPPPVVAFPTASPAKRSPVAVDATGQIMILSRSVALAKGEMIHDPVSDVLAPVPAIARAADRATFSEAHAFDASSFAGQASDSASSSEACLSMASIVEEIVKRQDARQAIERGEQEQRLIASLSQTLGLQIDKAIQREIANNIVPLFNRTITQQLQASLPTLISKMGKTMQTIVLPRLERVLEQSL
ncbi:MAG: hypothetical protein Q8P67_03240, partial [archaeon]|nr:hypothetical protein [archaeon]